MKNAVTLSENLGEAIVWFDGWYIDAGMPYPAEAIMPPSMWLDCREWADVHIQLEYTGAGWETVSAVLQTAVVPVTDLVGDDDPNDATTWLNLSSRVLVNPTATIQATSVGTFATPLAPPEGGEPTPVEFWEVPPMGVLRLKVTAFSIGTRGRLRAVVVGKKRG